MSRSFEVWTPLGSFEIRHANGYLDTVEMFTTKKAVRLFGIPGMSYKCIRITIEEVDCDTTQRIYVSRPGKAGRR